MDLSDFTPPTRQSLTDEQIAAHLGAATADEAGMVAAMNFLEEQTALREQDNQRIAQWQSKMKSSDDPRAQVALENFERAKSGLEALPIEEVSSTEPEISPQGSAEEAAEAFEELIHDAPHEAAEVELPQEPVSEPEVEPVPVLQPAISVSEPEAEIAESKPVGYRLVSAANWVLGIGVLAPTVAAVYAAVSGLNFVTSVLAGLIGILVGVKVNVFAFVTAARTHRGLAVASRASFGVFGAIIPGLLLLAAGIADLAAIAFASAKYFNGTLVGLPDDFTAPVFTLGSLPVSFAAIFAIVLVLLAATLAVFGGKFSRVVKIALGFAVLGGFLAFALYTTVSVDWLNLAGIFQVEEFFMVAPLFALLVSVFTYGLDSETVSIASWGVSKKRIYWPLGVFGFLLPVLSYSHMAALLNGGQGVFEDGATAVKYLLTKSGYIGGTILVDVALVAVLALVYMGVSKLIDTLKTVGTNHIGYGLASLVSTAFVLVIASEALFLPNPLEFNLSLIGVLLISGAYWIGVAVTEALLRRGQYHDASLTRGYGFYGSFNWVAFIGYVLALVGALGVSEPIPYFPWLGYLFGLTGIKLGVVYAAWAAMGFALIFTLATAYPRIRRQQEETKAVADRRYDLANVVVD